MTNLIGKSVEHIETGFVGTIVEYSEVSHYATVRIDGDSIFHTERYRGPISSFKLLDEEDDDSYEVEVEVADMVYRFAKYNDFLKFVKDSQKLFR